MLKQRTRDGIEFDNAFDANGRLKSGITLIRVPLKMQDSASVRDSDGLRQPGFTAKDSAGRDARAALYDTYDAEIASQWQNPPTGQGSHGFVGCRAGDL